MERLKIEDVIEKEGVYVATICGFSMYPMLRNRRDTVVIKPYTGRLRKFDVPLYKVGDRYILHRIIEVRPDSYVIRGDNCLKTEFGITDKQILGVLTSFYRDDKEVDLNSWLHKTYIYVWHYTFGLRKLVKRVYYKFWRRKAVDAGSDIIG